jgi:hypothetical protein
MLDSVFTLQAFSRFIPPTFYFCINKEISQKIVLSQNFFKILKVFVHSQKLIFK